MKQETEGITYKIRTKGVYDYFQYVFNRIYERGNLYIAYVTDTDYIFKAIDYKRTLREVKNHDFSTPFVKTYNVFPFFDLTVDIQGLDDIPVKHLDEDPTWYLDSDLFESTIKITNHIMVEFILDEIVSQFDNSISGNFLITEEYFRYLERATEYGRRVSDIPHIGGQLTLLTDMSGDYNVIYDIEAYCRTTEYLNDEEDFIYLLAGNDNDGFFYKKEINFNERYTDSKTNPTYFMMQSYIPAREIYPDIIAQGDGVNTTFDSNTYGLLEHPEIVPNTFKVLYVHLSLIHI